MSSIWNTQKTTTENKSVWGSIRQEPQQQQVPPNASVFETQHVYKAMPIFTTILADHVEFNKYLKQVILEHQSDELTTHQYTFAYLVGFLGGTVGLCCCACYAWLLRDDIKAAEAARMEVEADEHYQAPQRTGGGGGAWRGAGAARAGAARAAGGGGCWAARRAAMLAGGAWRCD